MLKILNEVGDVAMRKKLLEKVECISEILKYSYVRHVNSIDDFLQNFNYILYASAGREGNREGPPEVVVNGNSYCTECSKPMQLAQDILERIEELKDGVVIELEEVKRKTVTVMDHQHRYIVQNIRINEIYDICQNTEGGTSRMSIKYYKMTLEPIRFREPSTEWFRKRGFSWHGTVLFYVCNEETDVNTEHGMNNTGI